MQQLLDDLLQSKRKLKLLEINGGHVPQCPIAGDATVLNSGYIWNKTEIKLKQNNFVSVLFQTWLHVK